ncbi:CD81 antigen-like [Drosophila elegans]|uniref:CD81 antigen-like n=1 Tax=Drosophila elegans TaxID=30023 RepID=UPI001BC8428B|nr:CD81 antigen-like [Drosophila elegans]
MDFGTSLVKYILFIVNFIVGLITIEFVVVLIQNEEDESYSAVIPIAVGVILVFTSFLGCCGAACNSIWLAKNYAAILLIQMISQLTLLVLLFNNKEQFEKFIGFGIDMAWKWHGIRCGQDFSEDHTAEKLTTPASSHKSSPISSNFYERCRGEWIDWVTGTTNNHMFLIIGLMVIELVFFIFSCCFANNLGIYKKQKQFVLPITTPKSTNAN